MEGQDSPASFVDVRHLSAEYAPPPSLLHKISGRPVPVHTVLHDISFKLAQGDRALVYAPAAAGKSTLLRLLSGACSPSAGKIWINGKNPAQVRHLAAGYVAKEESEPRKESVYDVLYAFGRTHGLAHLPARLSEAAETLGFAPVLSRPAASLSSTERLRVNLARALLSDAPLLLLDDMADDLGPAETKRLLDAAFPGQTVLLTTRHTAVAEQFDWPILLLHGGRLAQNGTRDELASAVACPRLINAWIEGLRYDLLRSLKQHPGVLEVRLLPSTQFSGQQLRITLHSSRYLPSLYDLLSQAPLISVEEVPPTLNEILEKL